MTNILDIFSVGFDSKGLKDFDNNLKKTRADLDKAEGDVKALEAELENLKKIGYEDSDTFKAVSKALEEAQKKAKALSDEIKTMEGKSEAQLNNIRKNFMKVTRAIAALAFVGATVKKSLAMYEEAEQIGLLAKKADIAVESLQKLSNISKRYGGDVESTSSTIQNLQTKETKETMVKAGISIGDTPETTLENIAIKMESLKTTAEKLELSKALGLDESTTALLMEGVQKYREELKRTSKYRLYTKEDIERMRDFRQVQSDIEMNMRSINMVISSALLPVLTKLFKGFKAITDWAAEHEGAVKIATVFIIAATAIGGVVLALKALNGAIAMIEKHPMVLIIIGIAAAIALVIAVIQDLVVFFQGGYSIIGSILQRMGADTEAIRQIYINLFNSIKNGIKSAIEWFQSLGGKIAEIAGKIKQFWDSIPGPLKKLIGLSNPITGAMTIVSTAKEQIANANNNPANAIPAGAVQNYNTAVSNNNNRNKNTKVSNSNKKTTNIGSITINTQAKDGAEVAKSIQTISESDDGLVA